MAVRMGEKGQDTGVKDRNGRPIHIGDTLDFDPKEWGGPCRFTVGYKEGQLTGCGTISDWSEWCTVLEEGSI